MRDLFVRSVLMLSWLAICPSTQAHEDAVVAIRSFGSRTSEYGTGFVTLLDGDKVVVTNIHVVQGADNPLVIYLRSGEKPKTIRTKIKKLFEDYDLAVLEPLQELPILPLPRKEMTPAELKKKKNLRVIGYFHGVDDQQDSSIEVTSDKLSVPSYRNSSGKLVQNPIKVITLGGLSYNGMSGSPILLERQVVGVMWASVNEGGSFCWALPIRYLKEDSKDWKTWTGLNFPVLEFRESLRSGRQSDPEGQNTPYTGWSKVLNRKMNWNEARKFCNNYTASGHSNWKLPTLDELENATKDTLGITDQEVWAKKNGKPAYFDFEFGEGKSKADPEYPHHVLCITD